MLREGRQRDAANRVIDDAVEALIASSSKATVTAIGLSVGYSCGLNNFPTQILNLLFLIRCIITEFFTLSFQRLLLQEP